MSSSQAPDKERDKAGDGRYARPSGSSSGRYGTSRRGDGRVPPPPGSSQAADKEGNKTDGGPYARSSDSSWGRFRTSPRDADSVRGPPPMSFTQAADKADPYARPVDSFSGRSRMTPLDYGVKRTGSLLQPTPPQRELMDVAGAFGGDALLLGKVQDRPADARAVGDLRPVEGTGVLDAGAGARGDPQLGDDAGVLDMDTGDDAGVLDMDTGDDADDASGEPAISQANLDEVNARYEMNMIPDRMCDQVLLHDLHSRQLIETVVHSNLQSRWKLSVAGVDQVTENVKDHASDACGQIPTDEADKIRTTLDVLNQGLPPAQMRLDLVSTTAGIDLKPEDVQNCLVGRGTKADPKRKRIRRRPVKRAMPGVSSYCKIDLMKDSLEVENVQDCPVVRGPKVDPQRCPVKPAMPQVSAVYRKINKMDHLDLEDYTCGIHNNDLTCMILAVLLFNIFLPFLPLPLSMNDPISVVWGMSLLICFQIFLLIVPIRTLAGLMDVICRTLFGLLLGFAISKLVSSVTGMAIAYLSTAWVGGMFGYTLAQYAQHVGIEQEANVAVTFHLSLSKEKRRHRVYTQIDSVFYSTTMIVLLAALILWLVSSATEDIYFIVWILSVLVWWIVCFSLLMLSAFMLDGPCVTERTMAYYIASFPASIPLALVSQLLWVYFFGLEMIVMAAFFGYKLAIYARYRDLVSKGGEDTANLEDGNEDGTNSYTSGKAETLSDSSESGDEESTASCAAAPTPAHEEITTSSYSTCSSTSDSSEPGDTASSAAAPTPAQEEINTSSYSSSSSSPVAAPAPANAEITAAIRDWQHEESMPNGGSKVMLRELEKLELPFPLDIDVEKVSYVKENDDDMVEGTVNAVGDVVERTPDDIFEAPKDMQLDEIIEVTGNTAAVREAAAAAVREDDSAATMERTMSSVKSDIVKDLKKLVQNAAALDVTVDSADPLVTNSDTVKEETLPMLTREQPSSRKKKREQQIVVGGGFLKGKRMLGC